MDAAVRATFEQSRAAKPVRENNEIRLPRAQPAPAERNVEVAPAEDAVVSALKAEPRLSSSQDAFDLANSLAGRIARRGADAVLAQGNISGESVRSILE